MTRLNALTAVRSLKAWSGAVSIIIVRITRVWNQTGQKHAGEPDIARTVLPLHNFLLWLLVLATYLDVVQRLSKRALPWASRHLSSAAAFVLGATAFSFKVAFTKADAPELLNGLQFLAFRPIEAASLVAQARAVFIGITVMTGLASLPLTSRTFCTEEKTPSTAFNHLAHTVQAS